MEGKGDFIDEGDIHEGMLFCLSDVIMGWDEKCYVEEEEEVEENEEEKGEKEREEKIKKKKEEEKKKNGEWESEEKQLEG